MRNIFKHKTLAQRRADAWSDMLNFTEQFSEELQSTGLDAQEMKDAVRNAQGKFKAAALAAQGGAK